MGHAELNGPTIGPDRAKLNGLCHARLTTASQAQARHGACFRLARAGLVPCWVMLVTSHP
jgi:hypothetical protein